MPSTSSGSLVTLDRFYDPIEARIVAGRLEASGIPVHLAGIHHISANWMLALALGGVQLQVPSARADEAREILAEDVALESDEDHCPNCGSADTVRESNRWRLSMLLVHAFSVPLPWGEEQRRCQSCGFRWGPGSDI